MCRVHGNCTVLGRPLCGRGARGAVLSGTDSIIAGGVFFTQSPCPKFSPRSAESSCGSRPLSGSPAKRPPPAESLFRKVGVKSGRARCRRRARSGTSCPLRPSRRLAWGRVQGVGVRMGGEYAGLRVLLTRDGLLAIVAPALAPVRSTSLSPAAPRPCPAAPRPCPAAPRPCPAALASVRRHSPQSGSARPSPAALAPVRQHSPQSGGQ
jgi:hypothetical protein